MQERKAHRKKVSYYLRHCSSRRCGSSKEECMFLGYSKETKGYLFYDHKDNKVFVSTHAKFLEDDYVNNFNLRSKVVLAESNEPIIEQPMDEIRDDVVVLDTPQDTTHERNLS